MKNKTYIISPTKGEQKIIDILIKNKIEFSKEYMFNDLNSPKGAPLRYDFAIFEDGKIKFLCEFDGIQHFKQVKQFQPTRKDFLSTQGKDRQKNSYALAHGIPLYRIPYWELEDIKTIDDIIAARHLVKNRYHNDDLKPPN